MKKLLTLLFVLTLMVSLFTGCGKDDGKSDGDSNGGDKNVASDNKKERQKIVINLAKMLDTPEIVQAIEDVQKLEKYSHVDFVLLEDSGDYETKIAVSIAGGEQVDILAMYNPIMKDQFAMSGTIQPIAKYLDEIGLDFEEEYGPYAAQSLYNGEPVMLPNSPTKWALYYNKKIFDDAGEEYLDPNEPITWDEYRALSKKLTSGEGENKIYGALQLTWPMFWYGEALMKLGGGEQFYNEEGLSNIEDAAFAEALEATYKMMHEDESIPTHADNVVSKRPATAFMNGQYGMFLQGSWLLSWATDNETFPRDWDLGVAPMPVDEGSATTKTWGVVGGIGIGGTSANPGLATEIVVDLIRMSSENSSVMVPTSQAVEAKNLFGDVGDQLGGEGLTKEILSTVFSNPETVMLTEKVSGKNAANYDKVMDEEVEKYFVKEQDLETTINNIKKRADKVIQEED
ncbi:extracellular solute-binding protein [Vallitalea pronyensis]|uniref:Extracellular solute-binding protein n=1 Tax=Vallitalea pronyensis TaxID=1348613 RepID=A0A8J8SID4_9FIRM|nr:extracellular solute-binding protein [Vallitalea pronyensis]QUI24461.1 extracellular solute-binding protein [Vallitalea pronyensis]